MQMLRSASWFLKLPITAELPQSRSPCPAERETRDSGIIRNGLRNALSHSLSFRVPLDKGNVDSGNEIGVAAQNCSMPLSMRIVVNR